jgi:cobalt-zinc-cadmium efflux system membrane fusion protein
LILCPALAACAEASPAAEPSKKPTGYLEIPRQHPARRFLQVEKVRRSAAQRELPVVGRITFDEAKVVNIATPLPGRVAEALVAVGTPVKQGQPLASIDSPEISALRADLRKALVDLGAAQKNLERVRLLIAEKAAARKDELSAEVDENKAAAEVQRLRARLKLIGKDETDDSQRFVLRAPRAGVIVKRALNVGEEVRSDSAAPLLLLADLSVVWVLADIPEREVSLVHKGQKAVVEVTSFPGRRFPGKVSHIGEVVTAETRTVQVRISLRNPKRELKPEMYARVFLDVSLKTPRLLIPTRALVVKQGKTVVFVEEEPGKFRPRTIVVGPEIGENHEVISGVREGESVVTRGALLLDSEIQRVL